MINRLHKFFTRSWVIVFLLIGAAMLNAQKTSCIYNEAKGLVVIEAEELEINTNWKLETTIPDYTGHGYIVWKGENFFNTSGKGLIQVKIKISNPGIYSVHWRTKVGEGSDPTECNDTWLKFPDVHNYFAQKITKEVVFPHGSGKIPTPEGSGEKGWFKVYSGQTTDWTWNTSTNDNDGYGIKVEFVTPGIYTMQISARSAHHFLDRIILHKDDISEAQNMALPISKCSINNSSIKEKKVYMAISDFKPVTEGGYKPFYKDNIRNALALDASLYKNVFAAANMVFKGESGIYNLELTTLTEIDGESTYKVIINDKEIGRYQNPKGKPDFATTTKSFEEVALNYGDIIAIAFNSHTNGKIPEGKTTAYSRGRWESLQLKRKK